MSIQIDITKEEILKLSVIDFKDKLLAHASVCKTRQDIEDFEKFLEDTSWEDVQLHKRRRDYQVVIDGTLKQIDSMLQHNVMSSHIVVEEQDVIEVQVENNIIVGFKSLENTDT